MNSADRSVEKPRLLMAATSPLTVRVLMRGQLKYMSEHGFEVHVLCGEPLTMEDLSGEGVSRIWTLPLKRTPSPFQDLIALFRIVSILRQIKPDIVNAGTPKAALLVLLAARFTRVPVRIYTLRGLRLETTTGLQRILFKAIERVTASCAHRIIAVSRSLANLYVEEGLSPAGKVIVLGGGSSNGVDTSRFIPMDRNSPRLSELREQLGIAHDANVLGFVGRLTKDKGIPDLLQVFEQVRLQFPSTVLLLVGSEESGDPLSAKDSNNIRDHEGIIAIGHSDDLVPYYNLMDILVLPTKREGFPNVVLEAASCGVPTVAYRVTGCVDTIEDGVTGMLASKEDPNHLLSETLTYLTTKYLKDKHGISARARAQKVYTQVMLHSALLTEYRGLLP